MKELPKFSTLPDDRHGDAEWMVCGHPKSSLQVPDNNLSNTVNEQVLDRSIGLLCRVSIVVSWTLLGWFELS
jgi:hypothetical protein